MFKTTQNFWDCACLTKYIHPKEVKHCPACGAQEDDYPDSRVNEVIYYGFATDESDERLGVIETHG